MGELEVAAGHGPLRTFLRASWRVATNPLPLSIALGLLVSALGLRPPVPVEKWIDLLGAAAAPCALFAMGLFLSDKSIKSGLADAGLATVVKMLVQPALAFLLLPLFGVDLRSVPGMVALLMAALPTAEHAPGTLVVVEGQVPDLTNPPPGCRFAPRCPHRMPVCTQRPPPIARGAAHTVACWLYSE